MKTLPTPPSPLSELAALHVGLQPGSSRRWPPRSRPGRTGCELAARRRHGIAATRWGPGRGTRLPAARRPPALPRAHPFPPGPGRQPECRLQHCAVSRSAGPLPRTELRGLQRGRPQGPLSSLGLTLVTSQSPRHRCSLLKPGARGQGVGGAGLVSQAEREHLAGPLPQLLVAPCRPVTFLGYGSLSPISGSRARDILLCMSVSCVPCL